MPTAHTFGGRDRSTRLFATKAYRDATTTRTRSVVRHADYSYHILSHLSLFSLFFQADEELEPAEAEETRAKEAYAKACRGEGSSSSAPAASDAAPAVAEDPYAYLKPTAASEPAAGGDDDDFM